ncbi:hypothetical protein DPB41_23575 [Salmonella enterica subsp. enterica serovar Oslo]|nr:hypothetical protein [Salmonella enterica subsp. enterica serovar Oslo]ECU6857734.1 hypothetical protein [Salmonella enterica subsp. enterica serovar Oslo]
MGFQAIHWRNVLYYPVGVLNHWQPSQMSKRLQPTMQRLGHKNMFLTCLIISPLSSNSLSLLLPHPLLQILKVIHYHLVSK